MTLVEFLLARIAEDEADARREDADYAHTTLLPTYDSEHQARWNTARVLAECEAKRRIIDLYAADEQRVHDDESESPEGAEWILGRRQGAWQAVRALALPYADHPAILDGEFTP